MARRTAPGLARTRSRKTVILAAVAAAGALSLAACGSSGSGSGSSTSTTGTGSTTSGSIVWSASPIAGAGATDTRTVLINAFEKAYPKIKVTLVSASTNTDTNRATLATTISGGSSTPDVFMGDVIWPAQFGSHQLAVPLSNYLPQATSRSSPPASSRVPPTRARSTVRRCSRTRASCTTARTCWRSTTCPCPPPGRKSRATPRPSRPRPAPSTASSGKATPMRA